MKILKKPKILVIILIFFLIINCQTMMIKIDNVEDFSWQYQAINTTLPDEEIGKQILVLAKKEINYLRQYIDILLNRIRSADNQYIQIIENLEKENE